MDSWLYDYYFFLYKSDLNIYFNRLVLSLCIHKAVLEEHQETCLSILREIVLVMFWP